MSDTWPAVSSPIYRIRIDRSDFSRWRSLERRTEVLLPSLQGRWVGTIPDVPHHRRQSGFDKEPHQNNLPKLALSRNSC
jgi:hypothetical protein